MRGHDLFRYGAIVACLLCYTTILLGGNVMASGSGLACPDWPSCFGNGNLLPAFHGSVALEWSHRVSAFFLSVCVLTVFLLAIVYERSRPALLRISFGTLALVVGEALLGGVVVESQLQVPIILLHLALATALFGLLLVLATLSNLRGLPRRWLEWARRAADENPTPPVSAPGAGAPNPVPVPEPTLGRPRGG
ncbi:MAG: COX15/CtaA family protein [Thermoplasmata archaeon]|jgi:cytochrome c oxidase assembly protein subunit 15